MIDEVEITVQGGRGGDGLVSFLTQKFKPKGPPDGGNGGDGGNVYLIANTNVATLKDFSHKKLFKAESGIPGGSNNKTGRRGNDLYIKVPVGTGVFLSHLEGEGNSHLQGDMIADLDTNGQAILIAKGGKGGRGNAHMSSDKIRELSDHSDFIQYTGRRFSKNKQIYYAERAFDGQEMKLKLELKLIADVGIIGLPNAGKSSLLNALTETTKAAVGAYPFTTLEPNLGVIFTHTTTHHHTRCGVAPAAHTGCVILADIPGLIEGAYEGKGLGNKFLKHIERTKILVHVVEVPVQRTVALWAKNKKLKTAYKTVREELKKWSPALLNKPEIVVLNKVDLLSKADFPLPSSTRSSDPGRPTSIIYTSTITGEGIEKLKKRIIKLILDLSKAETKAKTKKEIPPFKFTLDTLPNRKIVFKKV